MVSGKVEKDDRRQKMISDILRHWGISQIGKAQVTGRKDSYLYSVTDKSLADAIIKDLDTSINTLRGQQIHE